MIRGLRDIYIYTSDMERSLEFYRDLLGLSVINRTEHWTTLDLGGVRFGLHWTGGPPVPAVAYNEHGALHGATITFDVANIDDVLLHLKAHNVPVPSQTQDYAWGRIAVLVDPDGNVIKLMEPGEGSI